MIAQQRTPEATRGDQFAMLRHVVLTAREKAVLRVIHDHGQGCWTAETTIARESGFSRATVQRAIADLLARSLICVERKQPIGATGRLTINHYTVVWTEIGNLIERQRTNNATAAPAMAASSIVAAEHPPSVADPDQCVTDQYAVPISMPHHDRINASPRGTKPNRNQEQETPPPRCAQIQKAEWGVADDFLRSEGIYIPGPILDRARDHKLTPEQFIAAAQRLLREANIPPNLALWLDPVAAWRYRLLNGVWPKGGVTPIGDWERQHTHKATAAEKRRMENTLIEITQQGRAKGVPDERIGIELRKYLPDEFCKERGW